MVDVGDKGFTLREAVAVGRIRMKKSTIERIRNREMEKGDVLAVAHIAGIAGAKKTADLIPLCHPLMLDGVDLSFEFEGEDTISIRAVVRTRAATGVEMEALTAVTTAALGIYDMCKAVDRSMLITDVHLEKKTGGRSGEFTWEGDG